MTRVVLAFALAAGLAAVGCERSEGEPSAGRPLAAVDTVLPEGEDFGAGLSLRAVDDLGDVFDRPERYADRPVLVQARVYDVCQRKGCWMVLREGESEVRVHFKDYGFFVPKDCTGQLALVEGRVETQLIDEDDARHYAEESLRGEAPADGPQRVVALEATGVRLVTTN